MKSVLFFKKDDLGFRLLQKLGLLLGKVKIQSITRAKG
ncbi:hypothetical protein C943_01822 [Mariniradius saccharolyticus AK6]|uniref:Uncharacterized protein n=1 Tax=Mariniradius saccharolyticus AK6 TaxID=1239962 RepID=M7XBA8_9BACT|nr:hypothetical protein C943_01822 [Mariniradius saccharolyticus AK6]